MNYFPAVLECVREGKNLEFSTEIFTLKPNFLTNIFAPPNLKSEASAHAELASF